jgi:hypothetical protein
MDGPYKKNLMLKKLKPLLSVVIVCLFALSTLSCSRIFGTKEEPYVPPVVFVGYVNNDYDSLPGNRSWPNTCSMTSDTVRMIFYSENFSEQNHIRSGDFLRIYLLPCTTQVTGLGTRYVIFHMARYRDVNYTYEVTPADTLPTGNSFALRILTLTRERGGQIDLDNINVAARPLTGTVSLELRNGRIYGTVQ